VKSLLLVLCIGVLSLCRLTFAQTSAPGQEAIPAKSDAQISFGALKGLSGTWTGAVITDPRNPEIDGSIQVTMRGFPRERRGT
jgi:hypothetical protein